MPLEVDVSLIDQRFLVAIDRRTLVAFPYQRRHHLRGPTACPFALGVQGMGIELEALRVYRDVDYSSPNGTGRSILLRDCVEHRGEYFVIGDNASISDDSRTWSQGPGLAGDTLVGKPFLAGFRMEWARIGPWSFRIPDISAIRYIR
jgi:hypothetical protein